MNAKEFRLGNIIKYDRFGNGKKEVFSIKEINDHDGVIALNFVDSSGSIHSRSLNNYIEPIPVTQEELLKFGFDCEYYGGQGNAGTTAIKETKLNLPHKNTFELYQYSGSNDWVFTKFVNYNTKIKYVHQLQNLYFALIGEELIYKS